MTKTEGKFCPECGYDMSSVNAYICPACGSESDSMFCPNCGTKMHGEADSSISGTPDNSVGAASAENNSLSEVHAEARDSGEQKNQSLSAAEIHKTAESAMSGINGIGNMMKKRPVISGGIVALAILVLIAAFSSGGNSGNTANTGTDSYTESEQTSDYDSDSTYSDSSTSYSSTDDGMDIIQGTWYLKGLVNDGESTDTSGYSLGKLIISGDKWDMTLNAAETTNNKGTLYMDFKDTLDDGSDYYIYTMKSDDYGGSVKMAYSVSDGFIAVSTSSTFDADNCMFFGK